MTAADNTAGFKTLAQFAEETGKLETPGINDIFIAETTVGQGYVDILQATRLKAETLATAYSDQGPEIRTEIFSLPKTSSSPF